MSEVLAFPNVPQRLVVKVAQACSSSWRFGLTGVVAKPANNQVAEYDAIVVGGGISGMFMLYRLRELGLTARVFESGTNVGGTWYWNRYPGARFDPESWTYGYLFSKELLQEWNCTEHFSPQQDTLEYLNLIADKFDLRRDMQFRSTVKAAQWDDADNKWTATLESGQQARARFLFTTIGILSAHTLPQITGIESVRGPAYRLSPIALSPITWLAGRTRRFVLLADVSALLAPEQPRSRRSRRLPKWLDTSPTGVNRNVEGRSVRRVLGYNGNGVHYRRKCEAYAIDGYLEFAFR